MTDDEANAALLITCRELHLVTQGAVIVIAWPAGKEHPAVAVLGSTELSAPMLQLACEVFGRTPRPAYCDACAAAWDRIAAAAFALTPTPDNATEAVQ